MEHLFLPGMYVCRKDPFRAILQKVSFLHQGSCAIMLITAKSNVNVTKNFLILIVFIDYIVVNNLKSSLDIFSIETSHSR